MIVAKPTAVGADAAIDDVGGCCGVPAVPSLRGRRDLRRCGSVGGLAVSASQDRLAASHHLRVIVAPRAQGYRRCCESGVEEPRPNAASLVRTVSAWDKGEHLEEGNHPD